MTDTKPSNEPLFMQHRYKLTAPAACTLPSNSYFGTYIVDSCIATAPVNTWLTKKTRALRAFYFTSIQAGVDGRMQQKRRLLLELSGSDTAITPTTPSHFYLPLEAGAMVWSSFPVPSGSRLDEAVSEALWAPMSSEAAAALFWYTTYLHDSKVTTSYTLHQRTKAFLQDYDEFLRNGTALRVLSAYIGPIQNDGSVHARRRNGNLFPCVV